MSDQEQIKGLMNELAEGIRNKNIDQVMSIYAPDVVAFDMLEPLSISGVDQYKRNWEMALAMDGPITYRIRDLMISAQESIAFSYAFHHFSATRGDMDFDMWFRMTHGYRKIDQDWKVVHEHASVPFDMENEKPLFNLQP